MLTNILIAIAAICSVFNWAASHSPLKRWTKKWLHHALLTATLLSCALAIWKNLLDQNLQVSPSRLNLPAFDGTVNTNFRVFNGSDDSIYSIWIRLALPRDYAGPSEFIVYPKLEKSSRFLDGSFNSWMLEQAGTDRNGARSFFIVISDIAPKESIEFRIIANDPTPQTRAASQISVAVYRVGEKMPLLTKDGVVSFPLGTLGGERLEPPLWIAGQSPMPEVFPLYPPTEASEPSP
jgi:hypothetical protein